MSTDGNLLVTPPSADPLKRNSFATTSGVTDALYQFLSTGLTREHDEAIEETENVLTRTTEKAIHDPDNASAYSVRKGFWFHVDGALVIFDK